MGALTLSNMNISAKRVSHDTAQLILPSSTSAISSIDLSTGVSGGILFHTNPGLMPLIFLEIRLFTFSCKEGYCTLIIDWVIVHLLNQSTVEVPTKYMTKVIYGSSLNHKLYFLCQCMFLLLLFWFVVVVVFFFLFFFFWGGVFLTGSRREMQY